MINMEYSLNFSSYMFLALLPKSTVLFSVLWFYKDGFDNAISLFVNLYASYIDDVLCSILWYMH